VKRALLLSAALAAMPGCGSRSCGLWDQARVEISFDARTQNANQVVVAATLGKLMHSFDLDKRAGSDHESLEIEFADKQVPSYGDTLSLTVTAVKDAVVLGVGHSSQHISPGCETVDVSVSGINGSCSGDTVCGAGTCTNERCCYGFCQ